MSENNRASVYVHINLVNGKKYFGITTQNPPEKRWQNGNGYYNNAHFMNAVKKYKWENFAHLILFRDIPIKIAKNIEEMLIDEHMSYNPRFGYNKTYGGELEIPTEEARQKMSEAKKELYTKHPEKNPMKRPEVAAKNAAARSKPVEAVDPESGQMAFCFRSTMDAGRAGFDYSNIAKCCNGKRKTHCGLIWRYVEEVNNDDSDNRG